MPRAEFACALPNEQSIKYMINIKGASGTRVCVQCKTVIQIRGEEVELDGTNYCVGLATVDKHLFGPNRDMAALEAAYLLAKQSTILARTDFAKLGQALD